MINTLLHLAWALILTVIVESVIALLLKMSKSDIIHIILINSITNPVLNYLLILIGYFSDYRKETEYICVFFLEIIVIISEYLYFKKSLEFKRIPLFPVSVILNFSSFSIGMILNICMNKVFPGFIQV